jgi:ABC-type multidrug transport system fused ATPase/permease subunit
MDQILMLHRGDLRESGTHDQLLRAGGVYRRLWMLQNPDWETEERREQREDSR